MFSENDTSNCNGTITNGHIDFDYNNNEDEKEEEQEEKLVCKSIPIKIESYLDNDLTNKNESVNKKATFPKIESYIDNQSVAKI